MPQRATMTRVNNINFLYLIFCDIRRYVQSAESFVQVMRIMYWI